MNAALLRRLARRCWELMRSVRTDAGREQLRLWAEEFEQQADAADQLVEALEPPAPSSSEFPAADGPLPA